jgi:Fe2+ transport system protein FeoA
MELTLNNLPLNAQAIIISNPNDKLQELGFMIGSRVRIIARTCFNGPIAVKIETATFALRRDEAEQIYVELIQ